MISLPSDIEERYPKTFRNLGHTIEGESLCEFSNSNSIEGENYNNTKYLCIDEHTTYKGTSRYRAKISEMHRMFTGNILKLIVICTILINLKTTSYAISRPQGRELEKQIVDKILGEGYDKRIRPSGRNNVTGQSDGPALVRVNTLIRSISKIDDVTMEYSCQLTLRQEWKDERLAYNQTPTYRSYNISSITLTEQERIWKPDLFFRNEKEGHFHKIIMPNVLLRINGDGSVLYSIRISLVLACPMDLKYYPLDKQNCTIEMASYGYQDGELRFQWKETEPVQIAKPLTLPRFTLESHKTDFCTSRTTTGAYSCLRVDLIFKREFSYYLIQIYIPCCMLVIVSWVSFWLDPNAIPARVSLGVTTLLTMATQISGINASLPPVSYTKAIDVWTGVCLTFVFGALLEFALVNYASRSDAHHRMQQARQMDELRAREYELQQQRQQLTVAFSQNQPQHNASSHQQHSHHAQAHPTGHPQQTHQNHHYQLTHQPRSLNQYHGQYHQPQYPNGVVSNGNYQIQKLRLNHRAESETTKSANGDGSSPVRLQSQQQQQQQQQAGQQYTIVGDALSDKQLHSLTDALIGHQTKQCEIHQGGEMFHLLRDNGRVSGQANSRQSGRVSMVSSKLGVNFVMNWLRKFPSRSKRIDVISRIFFPLMFALFNLVYWTTYLFRDDDIVRV